MKKNCRRKEVVTSVVWALVLFGCVGLILCITYSDYKSGAIYTQDAYELGMDEGAAEEYRLYCLRVRQQGEIVPSPADWAKERFERLRARPGSVLEMLIETVWQPALDEEREAARQETIAKERARERALYGGWSPNYDPPPWVQVQ